MSEKCMKSCATHPVLKTDETREEVEKKINLLEYLWISSHSIFWATHFTKLKLNDHVVILKTREDREN